MFGRVDGVGLHDHADAGDANFSSYWSLPHRSNRSIAGWMAINCGEEFSFGDQNKFILRALANRSRHQSLERDEVVLMAVRVTLSHVASFSRRRGFLALRVLRCWCPGFRHRLGQGIPYERREIRSLQLYHRFAMEY